MIEAATRAIPVARTTGVRLTPVGFLACFVALGRPLDPVVLAALGAKFAYDLGMHARCVWLHARWQREPLSPRRVARSLLATFTEPFAFQFLRQFGALLGWLAFLRGRIDWAPQRPPTATPPEP